MNSNNPIVAAFGGAVAAGGYVYLKSRLDVAYDLNIEFGKDVEAFDVEPALIGLCNRHLTPLREIRGVSERVDEFIGYVDDLLLRVKVLNSGEKPMHGDRAGAKASMKLALFTFR